MSFCIFPLGHCVVCSSSIYRFWLPLWYLQTFLNMYSIATILGFGDSSQGSRCSRIPISPVPMVSEFWSGESGFLNLSCWWTSKFQLLDWRVKNSFQIISKLSIFHNYTNEESTFYLKYPFLYEMVISSSLRGYYSVKEGNTCCVVINVREMFVSRKKTHVVLSSMSAKCLFRGRKHMCYHQCQGNVCSVLVFSSVK